MFDKILSHFSIRTKVLFFVIPFIVSIAAVGLLGTYAAGVLQASMSATDQATRLLTGLRDVGSDMNGFLAAPSPQSRDKVNVSLKTQQDAFASVLAGLGEDGPGRENLLKAEDATRSVAGRIDALWTLYGTEKTLAESIRQKLNVLMAAQISLSEQAQTLQRDVRKLESQAKSALREADRLTAAAQFLASLANQAQAAGAPERQFPFLSSKLTEIFKTQRKIATALPENQKILSENLGGVAAELDERLKSGDFGEDNAQEVKNLLRKLRQMSEQLDQAARQKNSDSIAGFAAIDGKVIAAEEVLAGSRLLVSGVYDLRIVAAAFLLTPEAVTRNQLVTQIGQISGNLEKLGASIEDKAFFESLSAKIKPALEALGSDSAALVAASEQHVRDFAEAAATITGAWDLTTAFTELQKTEGLDKGRSAKLVSLAATVIGAALAVIAGYALVITLQRPIAAITAAMRKLADGDVDVRIKGERRRDELGAMARALSVFRDNARARLAAEAESEQHRAAAEAERSRNDADKRRTDAEIEFAVARLANGLERLAAGDISFSIDEGFAGQLDRLRVDFNRSLSHLREAMGKVIDSAEAIRSNCRQMAESTDGLSKRTEQQAASLEETAAAVDEITVTVRNSAERAHEANGIVRETTRDADASAAVVHDAVGAMGRIEEASRHIEQIVDVIEDIAFQTNLLALNAGIEAARAGEAGKGFAVVAQEVRELAQRSGTAANEIKVLIEKSVREVATGSTHVEQAGKVLSRISGRVTVISQHVEVIATAARDQAAALQEVNSSVNDMDQMTQKNAAMAEEATAVSHDLAQETEELMALISGFKIHPDAGSVARRRAA